MPPPSINQKPEQIARDRVDAKLAETGWHVQDKDKIDFSVGRGIAIREYPTDIGPVDYVLFVDRRAIGVIEAKPEDWGHKITTVEHYDRRRSWIMARISINAISRHTRPVTSTGMAQEQ